MSNRHFSYLSSEQTEGDAVLEEGRAFVHRRELALVDADGTEMLSDADRAQLDREVAAIERASAALRRAEPELQHWTETPAAVTHQPRPVWLLIGVLWLSTALVTIGAVVAISALVG